MIELIRQRLVAYKVSNALEEEQALKEILQEVTLYLLWRGQFFDVAAFQGGTSLRILHKLPRFSEDLDFILLRPDVMSNRVSVRIGRCCRRHYISSVLGAIKTSKSRLNG